MNPHDEYVDHSCSTALERLSRDVETELRRWHVADGSDRHVSFRVGRKARERRRRRLLKARKERRERRRREGRQSQQPQQGAEVEAEAEVEAKVEAEAEPPRDGAAKGDGGARPEAKFRWSETAGSLERGRGGDDDSQRDSEHEDKHDWGHDDMHDWDAFHQDDDQHGEDETKANGAAADEDDDDDDDDDDDPVKLLRSSTLTLSALTVTNPDDGTSERVDVPLVLCLWDAPAPPPTIEPSGRQRRQGAHDSPKPIATFLPVPNVDHDQDGDDNDDNGHRGTMVDDGDDGYGYDDDPPLPLSLRPRWRRRRRRPRKTANGVAVDVGEGDDLNSSLSALLGVGQHLTLSLLPPSSSHDNKGAYDDDDDDDDATSGANDGSRRQATTTSAALSPAEKVLRSLLAPHQPSSCLEASSSLASMLQSALDCASERCDCRIPTFGIWNVYDPQPPPVPSAASSAGMSVGSSHHWTEAAEGGNAEGSWEWMLPEWLAPLGAPDDDYGDDNYDADDGYHNGRGNGTNVGAKAADDAGALRLLNLLGGRCQPGPDPRSGSGTFAVYYRPPGMGLRNRSRRSKDGAHHAGHTLTSSTQPYVAPPLWTLDGLARILLRHSGDDARSSDHRVGRVVVCRKRHIYLWFKRSMEMALANKIEERRKERECGRAGSRYGDKSNDDDDDDDDGGDDDDDDDDEELMKVARIVRRAWRTAPDALDDDDDDEDNNEGMSGKGTVNRVGAGGGGREAAMAIRRKKHRRKCDRHALALLRMASSESLFAPAPEGQDNGSGGGAGAGGRRGYDDDDYDDEPMWGPPDDPLLRVRVSARWNEAPYESEDEEDDGGNDTASARDAATATATSIDGGAPASPSLPEGLLTLPLRVRSSRGLSRREFQEMEFSLRRAIFNPVRTVRPGDFLVHDVAFDPDVAAASLSAGCRCVLAALVRVCSLGPDALLGHLVNESVLEEMGLREMEEERAERERMKRAAFETLDDDMLMMEEEGGAGGYGGGGAVGRSSAAALAEVMRASKLGLATRNLVEAMDWKSMAEERHPDDEEIMADAVRRILDMAGGRDGSFPSPPQEMFRSSRRRSSAAAAAAACSASGSAGKEDTYNPKAAPPARLLSLLCRAMASLRTPSGMAALWLAFADELRQRWERREGVPNMGRIVGLDPDCDDVGGGGGARRRFGMGPAERRRFALGLGWKADGAAFVHCSEPDPDMGQCVLWQTFQLLNIGVESVVAAEGEELRRLRLQQQEEEEHQEGPLYRRSGMDGKDGEDGSVVSDGFPPERCSSSVASTEVANNLTPGERQSSSVGDATSTSGGYIAGLSPVREKSRRAASRPIARGGFIDTGSYEAGDTDDEDDDDYHEDRSASTTDQFFETHGENESMSGMSFDAAEGDGGGFVDGFGRGMRGLGGMLLEAATNVTQRQARKGARCPVHGVSLIASGDQLYAPYLQRTAPLTEQTLRQRRALLEGGENIQARIQVAHRLQKPKLLSDMSSFKAANPGAVFQDFVDWYGNPGDPLEDDDGKAWCVGAKMTSGPLRSNGQEADLEAASAAIQVLMATRTFWSDAWDEATPCPASEQKPLFDAPGTVEYVLDAIETVQPAHLINQALAVNLAAAAFILRASAGPAIAARVPAVAVALERLEVQVERACAKLGRDVAGEKRSSSSTSSSSSVSGRFASGGGSCRSSVGEREYEGLWRYVKADTIADCESACDAIGDVEIILSRAMTLLHKFPREYDVVQSLLRRSRGRTFAVDSPSGREGIISAVRTMQNLLENSNELARPSVREFVLRNCDEDYPCQLSARMGESGVASEKGLLLSISRSERDY